MALPHLIAALAAAILGCTIQVCVRGAPATASSTLDQQFLTPPPGSTTIGESHGDIAVSRAGDIYVSVQSGAEPSI